MLKTLVPTGTYSIGRDGYMEFQADEAALEQMILTVFYDKAS
jgi:hypothetical protein